MKTYTCALALDGKQSHVVNFNGLTIAELSILRRTHGEDSCFNIAETEDVRRTEAEERERLEKKYSMPVIQRLFGDFGSLPSDISALRIEDTHFLSGSPAPKKRRGRKKADEVETKPDPELYT
jgi:hypothetical protein